MAQKAGFLTKEGGSIKTWKKRWCVLKNGTLTYSKNQSSGDLGTIQLDAAGEIKVSQRKKKNCLQIQTPARTYYMCAESADSRDDWIRELIGERDRAQGKQNTPTSDKESSAPTTAQKEKVNIEDFELLTVVGKGSFGKVNIAICFVCIIYIICQGYPSTKEGH